MTLYQYGNIQPTEGETSGTSNSLQVRKMSSDSTSFYQVKNYYYIWPAVL